MNPVCKQKINISLFGGIGGELILKAYTNNSFEKKLQIVLDNLDSNFSFSSGFSGIFWLIANINNNVIKYNEDIFLELDDIILKKSSNLNFFNYDFMHSDLSIIPYLIERKNSKEILKILNKLLKNTVKFNEFELYEERFSKRHFSNQKINLGMAHGIASILAICNIIYKENIEKIQSFNIMSNLYDFYNSILVNKTEKSFLPNFIIDGQLVDYQKRLAWCYGDLSVLYHLLISSKLIDNKFDKKIILRLKELANYTFKDSFIFDAGFCHGTHGVAYIFFKIYELTKDPIFKDASNNWIKIGKEILNKFNNQSYNNVTNIWVNDKSLLTGFTGIKLVEKTINNQIDSNWDRCFLLS